MTKEESVQKARERMNQMDLVSWGFVRDLNGESMHAEFRGKCW